MFNTCRYIEACIGSVLRQSFPSFECIVVNDGSSDNSRDIAQKAIGEDLRFRIIDRENGGLSAARNTGIKNARGMYLVFLDSDDFIKENALADLDVRIEKEHPDCILSHTFSYFEKKERFVPRTLPDFDECDDSCDIFYKMAHDPAYVVAAWTLVVKKEYLLKHDLYFREGLLHEDELWVPQVILGCRKISINRRGFYCWRCEREGSITQTKNRKRIQDKLFIVDKLAELAQKSDAKTAGVLADRCAQLMTGIVFTIHEYKIDQGLHKEIKTRIKCLKGGYRWKYRGFYYICLILGIKGTNRLFRWGKPILVKRGDIK